MIETAFYLLAQKSPSSTIHFHRNDQRYLLFSMKAAKDQFLILLLYIFKIIVCNENKNTSHKIALQKKKTINITTDIVL